MYKILLDNQLEEIYNLAKRDYMQKESKICNRTKIKIYFNPTLWKTAPQGWVYVLDWNENVF